MSVLTVSGTMEQVSTGQYSQYAGQGKGEQVNTCQYSQFAGQLNMSVLTVCRTTEHASSRSMQDKGTGQYSQYAGHGKRSVLTVCRTREQVNKWPLSVISALYNFKFFTSIIHKHKYTSTPTLHRNNVLGLKPLCTAVNRCLTLSMSIFAYPSVWLALIH